MEDFDPVSARSSPLPSVRREISIIIQKFNPAHIPSQTKHTTDLRAPTEGSVFCVSVKLAAQLWTIITSFNFCRMSPIFQNLDDRNLPLCCKSEKLHINV